MVAASSGYVREAEARVLALLDEHLALVNPELQSRIAEGSLDTSENIDPHHVTTALGNLTQSGKIIWDSNITRGGRKVTTVHPAVVGRRVTKLRTATARKRLLMARYQGWSQGTQRHPHGLVGPAGELAVRTALAASGGLQPMVPDFGEVAKPLGVAIPGAIDSGGFLVPTIGGLPQQPISILVEVKSLRSWIYPSASELYQLLHKCVLLQQANPDVPLIPVLVCRRAHVTTFWMAKQLGFIVIQTEVHFAGDLTDAELDEVRNELHFTDLRPGHGPAFRVRDRFRSPNLIALAPTIAQTWADTALDAEFAGIVRQGHRSKSTTGAQIATAALRVWATSAGHRGGW